LCSKFLKNEKENKNKAFFNAPLQNDDFNIFGLTGNTPSNERKAR